MSKLTKEQLPWLVVMLFIGIAIGSVVVALSGRTRPAPIYITPPSPTPTALPDPTQAPMNVHLSGEVVSPDVYELPPGAILQDAIEAAGGFTESAAADVVNLALPLNTGMHVHIPAADQVDLEPVLIEGDAPAPTTIEGSPGQLINLNTAGSEELELLPGIGPATAQKIVDYRKANGPFVTVEDIQKVSGIGPSKLEQIRGLVTVD